MNPEQERKPNPFFQKVKTDIDWAETQIVGYYFFTQLGEHEALFIHPKDDVAVCYIFEKSLVKEILTEAENPQSKISFLRKDDIKKIE